MTQHVRAFVEGRPHAATSQPLQGQAHNVARSGAQWMSGAARRRRQADLFSTSGISSRGSDTFWENGVLRLRQARRRARRQEDSSPLLARRHSPGGHQESMAALDATGFRRPMWATMQRTGSSIMVGGDESMSRCRGTKTFSRLNGEEHHPCRVGRCAGAACKWQPDFLAPIMMSWCEARPMRKRRARSRASHARASARCGGELVAQQSRPARAQGDLRRGFMCSIFLKDMASRWESAAAMHIERHEDLQQSEETLPTRSPARGLGKTARRRCDQDYQAQGLRT